jgi:hypothetical protein
MLPQNADISRDPEDFFGEKVSSRKRLCATKLFVHERGR